MRYHFKIHREQSGGFWAECLELTDCQSQGKTKAELLENMEMALNRYLSEPVSSKHIFSQPYPQLTSHNIVAIPVHPSVAIANRIREIRLRSGLTQIAMKDQLGIKNLSNYQRLEDPNRANPEWQTLLKIKNAFPQFTVDDLLD